MVEYLGIDLGGTNIRIGAMDENENIIYEYKESTHKGVNTTKEFIDKIKNIIKSVPNYEEAKAIGIGIPGSIDNKKNEILNVKNINFLSNYPLVEDLKKEFNKEIYIENDARVAAFAEATIGKGKNKNNVCYITISTGLGGGIVINKELYQGSNNLGAYFSRMILDGERTSDELISGTALYKTAKQRINAEIKIAGDVFELKNNREDALKVVEEFKHNLNVLLLNISSTFNPDIIILGGGVAKSKGFIIDEIREKFKKSCHKLAKDTLIDIAECEEPGIIGACLLAKNKYKN